MSYKPVMKTIGSKLRELFSTSGQTVESALPNEIEVSGSGSDSGASGGVVTLYFTDGDTPGTFSEAYKDIAMTEGFSSTEEAWDALTTATVAKLCAVAGDDIQGVYVSVYTGRHLDKIICACLRSDGPVVVNVAIDDNENPVLVES